MKFNLANYVLTYMELMIMMTFFVELDDDNDYNTPKLDLII